MKHNPQLNCYRPVNWKSNRTPLNILNNSRAASVWKNENKRTIISEYGWFGWTEVIFILMNQSILQLERVMAFTSMVFHQFKLLDEWSHQISIATWVQLGIYVVSYAWTSCKLTCKFSYSSSNTINLHGFLILAKDALKVNVKLTALPCNSVNSHRGILFLLVTMYQRTL